MSGADEKLRIDIDELISSPKRRKFVINYVENGGKGTAAAEAAGFANPSMEQNRLLKDDKIQQAIAVHAGIVARVAGETRDTVLDRIRNRTKADIADYYKIVPLYDDEGEPMVRNGTPIMIQELKRVDELTRDESRRIKKITLNNNGYSLELHDPATADRDIARLMGLEPKEHEALSAEDAAQLIANAMDRMDELDGISSTSE